MRITCSSQRRHVCVILLRTFQGFIKIFHDSLYVSRSLTVWQELKRTLFRRIRLSGKRILFFTWNLNVKVNLIEIISSFFFMSICLKLVSLVIKSWKLCYFTTQTKTMFILSIVLNIKALNSFMWYVLIKKLWKVSYSYNRNDYVPWWWSWWNKCFQKESLFWRKLLGLNYL